jgi:glycosyltransferase involved in cell wall biosynthesis
MSDKEVTPVGYEGRTPGEMKTLEEQFYSSPYSGGYVAKPAPGYDVHGFWHCFGTHQRTGYATHAVALHGMLQKLGIKTNLVPHRNVDIDIDKFPEDRYDMLFGWMKDTVGYPHVLFCSYPPDLAAEMSHTDPARHVGPPVVPYCAFEGTRCSAFTRDLCNSPLFREVWVVSDFVKEGLVAGGVVPERVRVVRPPVCDGLWTMTPVDDLKKRASRPVTAEDPFIFATLGTWQKRKGIHDLIRAYFTAFDRTDPVKLVIRTSSFVTNFTISQFKGAILEDLAKIAKELGHDSFPYPNSPRLGLELGTSLTDQEVVDWIGSLDCYVNPSYGEGLGIPHIWAKAQGVPMVSTTYGAVGDLLDEIGNAADRSEAVDWHVPHQTKPVDPEILKIALMFDEKSEWGVYDHMVFGSSMMSAFKMGRKYDHKSAEYVRNAFSIDACLPAVREGLREILLPEDVALWNL